MIMKGDIMGIFCLKKNKKETEYAEKKKKLEELNRKRIQQLKMKSLLLKKHDVDDEFDEQYELSTEDDVVISKHESSIVGTLLSPPGAYILTSLLVFFAMYFMIDNYEAEGKSRKTK